MAPKSSKKTTAARRTGASNPSAAVVLPELVQQYFEGIICMAKKNELPKHQIEDLIKHSKRALGAFKGGGKRTISDTTQLLLHELTHANTIKEQGDSLQKFRAWFKQRCIVEETANLCKVNNISDSKIQLEYDSIQWLSPQPESICNVYGTASSIVGVIYLAFELLLNPLLERLRRWTVSLVSFAREILPELFHIVYKNIANSILNKLTGLVENSQPLQITASENILKRLETAEYPIEAIKDLWPNKHIVSSSTATVPQFHQMAQLLLQLESEPHLWHDFVIINDLASIRLLAQFCTCGLLVSVDAVINHHDTNDNQMISASSISALALDDFLRTTGAVWYVACQSNLFNNGVPSELCQYGQVTIQFCSLIQKESFLHSYTATHASLTMLNAFRVVYSTYSTQLLHNDDSKLLAAVAKHIFGVDSNIKFSDCLPENFHKSIDTHVACLNARASIGAFDSKLLSTVLPGTHAPYLYCVLWNPIRVACDAADPRIRAQGFAALQIWLSTAYKSLKSNDQFHKRTQLLSDASFDDLTALILRNWEHPAKVVSDAMQPVFEALLQLDDIASNEQRGGIGDNNLHLLKAVLAQSPTRKARFAALEVIVPRIGVINSLRVYPSLLCNLLEIIGQTVNVARPVASCWHHLIVRLRSEVESSMNLKPGTMKGAGGQWILPKMKSDDQKAQYTTAAKLWREYWLTDIAQMLVHTSRSVRTRVARYILPALLKLDNDCYHLILEILKQWEMINYGTSCHRHTDKGTSSNQDMQNQVCSCLGDDDHPLYNRIAFAQLNIVLLARQQGILKIKEESALLDNAAERITTKLDQLWQIVGCTSLKPIPALLDVVDKQHLHDSKRSCTEAKKSSLQSANSDIIDLAALLQHADTEIRLAALECVVSTQKQGTPLTLSEMKLVQYAFLLNNKSRQMELCHVLTQLLGRVLDRICVGFSAHRKRIEWLSLVQSGLFDTFGSAWQPQNVSQYFTSNGKEIEVNPEAQRLAKQSPTENSDWCKMATAAAFIQWIAHWSFAGLYSGSPHDRVMVCMDILQLLVTRFGIYPNKVCSVVYCTLSDSTIPFHDPLDSPIEPVINTHKAIQRLFEMFDGSWDPVRTQVTRLLRNFPAPLSGFEQYSDIEQLFREALRLCSSARARECDAGACMLRVLYSRYANQMGWYVTISSQLPDKDQLKNPATLNDTLTESIKFHDKNCKTDLSPCLSYFETITTVLRYRTQSLSKILLQLGVIQHNGIPMDSAIGTNPLHLVKKNSVETLLQNSNSEKATMLAFGSLKVDGLNIQNGSPLVHGILLALRYLVQCDPTVLTTTVYRSQKKDVLPSNMSVLLTLVESVIEAYNVALGVVAATDEGDGNLLNDNMQPIQDESSHQADQESCTGKQPEVGISHGRVDCRGHLFFEQTSTNQGNHPDVSSSYDTSTETDLTHQSSQQQDENSSVKQEQQQQESPEQVLVVSAWMIVKEGSACLAEIVRSCCIALNNAQIQARTGNSSSNQSMDNEDDNTQHLLQIIERIGELLLHSLLTLKHMGGVLHAANNFQIVCETLFRCSDHPRLLSLPSHWLNNLLERVGAASQQFILRRSAGFAMSVLAIVRAEPSENSGILLRRAVATLLYYADPLTNRDELDAPITRDEFYNRLIHELGLSSAALCSRESINTSEKSAEHMESSLWRSRVHALNILKLLIRESAVSSEIQPYLSRCLRASLHGFYCEHWAVRNSAMMVFAAAVEKSVGGKRTSDQNNVANLVTAPQLFNRYPTLMQLLLEHLEYVLVTNVNSSHDTQAAHNGLYPVLLLLSRLTIQSNEDESMTMSDETSNTNNIPHITSKSSTEIAHAFMPWLMAATAHPHIFIRSLAARAVAALLPFEDAPLMLQALLHDLFTFDTSDSISWNQKHGTALCLTTILEAFCTHMNLTKSTYDTNIGIKQSFTLLLSESAMKATDILNFACQTIVKACPLAAEPFIRFVHMVWQAIDTFNIQSCSYTAELPHAYKILLDTINRIETELCHENMSYICGAPRLLQTLGEFIAWTRLQMILVNDEQSFEMKHLFQETQHSRDVLLSVSVMSTKWLKQRQKFDCDTNSSTHFVQLIKTLSNHLWKRIHSLQITDNNSTQSKLYDSSLVRATLNALMMTMSFGHTDDVTRQCTYNNISLDQMFGQLYAIHQNARHDTVKNNAIKMATSIMTEYKVKHTIPNLFWDQWSTMILQAANDQRAYQRRLEAMNVLSKIPISHILYDFIKDQTFNEVKLESCVWYKLWKCLLITAQDDDDEVRDAARIAIMNAVNVIQESRDTKPIIDTNFIQQVLNIEASHLVGLGNMTGGIVTSTVLACIDLFILLVQELQPIASFPVLQKFLQTSLIRICNAADETFKYDNGLAFSQQKRDENALTHLSRRIFTTQKENEFEEPLVLQHYIQALLRKT